MLPLLGDFLSYILSLEDQEVGIALQEHLIKTYIYFRKRLIRLSNLLKSLTCSKQVHCLLKVMRLT